MKWWRRFWKRRKQDDRIKIMFLFFLGMLGFFADAVNSGIQVYQMTRSPAEYVVRSSGASEITGYQMSGIEAMSEVQAVSRQRESSMTLLYSGGEMTVTCLELSDDYLTLAYGMFETGAMKAIYLNEMAWAQLIQASGRTENGAEPEESIQLDYILGEDEVTERARVRCVKSGIPNDTARAFIAADSAQFSEGEAVVRIQTKGQDLEGTTVKQLGQLGLEIINSGEVQQGALEQRILFLRMRYAMIASLLCMAALVSLKEITMK